MATHLACFLRGVTRGIIRIGKRYAGTTQLEPIKQSSHYNFTARILRETDQSRNAKFFWSNLHSFSGGYGIANIRRKACQDFIRRISSRVTLLSFMGLYMKANGETQTSLSGCIEVFQKAFENSLKEESQEKLPVECKQYEITSRLGKPSSNGVVYAANYRNNEYAMKILFNLCVPSDSSQIKQKFLKEIDMLHLSPTEEKAKTGKRVMSHPNVITIHQTFVDDFPMLYDAMESYKIMLPKKYFNEGLGRNKTLFIIMPKCQTTLREYLSENRALTFDQRFHLLLQLLNAVAYLEKNNVSHRDLKCDNILLNSCDNYQLDYPRLILTDFGDCFCGINKMMLKYDSYDVSLGGNCALMAPEIINARPGKNSYVDYSKNDAWAVGAISYEIFGKNNPFYNTLRNDFYDEDALPLLSSRSQMVDIVVQHLLKKDPEKRISAGLAAAVLYIWRYGPLHWKIPNYLVTQSEIESWLLKLCIESRRECVKKLSISECQPNIQHSLVFLWMTSIDTIIASILFIQGIGATVYVVD